MQLETTLCELISRRITPELKDRNAPKIEALDGLIPSRADKLGYQFEVEVFQFLLDNKISLGVRTVMKFTALLMDGAIELADGQRLALEIKFRMNWEKACQAEWRFRNYLRRHQQTYPVSGGIVIFEDFSGDWQRQAGCRQVQNGWNNWYLGHSEVEGFRLDLLRLSKASERLESFPLVGPNIA